MARGNASSVGKLKLELREEETITTETARAQPIWDGQLIDMTPAWKKKKQVWTDRLHLNRVGDILWSNGNLWTLRAVEEYIKNARLKWSEYQKKYQYGIKRGGKTPWMILEELTREYRGIVERIPNYIIEAAKGRIRVREA